MSLRSAFLVFSARHHHKRYIWCQATHSMLEKLGSLAELMDNVAPKQFENENIILWIVAFIVKDILALKESVFTIFLNLWMCEKRHHPDMYYRKFNSALKRATQKWLHALQIKFLGIRSFSEKDNREVQIYIVNIAISTRSAECSKTYALLCTLF